jgi:CBS domain containing-hemolysin-like protein
MLAHATVDTQSPELTTFIVRLAATFFFVAANGFFVAAEFALVKVQTS